MQEILTKLDEMTARPGTTDDPFLIQYIKAGNRQGQTSFATVVSRTTESSGTQQGKLCNNRHISQIALDTRSGNKRPHE